MITPRQSSHGTEIELSSGGTRTRCACCGFRNRRPEFPEPTWAATHTRRHWRLVSWRNGTNAPWRARFCATRVTPAHDWRERPLAPEVWLLCERDLGTAPRTQYYLVNLPPTASLRALVRLAHQRWAIEQQYQELKDEIGLDHFEGRHRALLHHTAALPEVDAQAQRCRTENLTK